MKKIIALMLCIFSLFSITGCGLSKTDNKGSDNDKNEVEKEERIKFSEKYLVGSMYGGSSWGEFYECLSGKYILCKDGTVEIYMPEVENHTVTDYVLADTIKISDEDYKKIESSINLKKLYKLDPRPDNGVCDGYSIYLTIYNENDEVLKTCGGYMPRNEKFIAMYKAVKEILPTQEMYQIRDEWIENLRAEEYNGE